ncbi:hypothetical protein GSF24_33455 [Microbispora triticiradicis]|nr:hypothetical protein [Microbispora triticiradicis]
MSAPLAPDPSGDGNSGAVVVHYGGPNGLSGYVTRLPRRCLSPVAVGRQG